MAKRSRPKKIKEESSQITESSTDINNMNKEEQERKNKLKEVLRDINKNIDGATAIFASDIDKRERLSWGYDCLDKLTGGGLVKGVFTTIYGSKSCGKTTAAYKCVAANQTQNKIVAYIDMERSYDEIWAKKMGVDTETLVYIKSDTAEQALDSMIKLCKNNVVDLIVIDSIQGLCPKGVKYKGKAEKEKSVEDDTMALLARKLSQFFPMIIPHVSDSKCAVLLIGQARLDLGSFIKLEKLSGGKALGHNSRLILKIRRGTKADSPTEKVETDKVNKNGNPVKENKIVGFDCVIKVEKSQIDGCTELEEIHLPFLFDSGIKEK